MPTSPASVLKSLDPNDVYLFVNGKIYGGWENVRITRSLEAVAGSFDVSLTDRWEEGQEPWPIFDGDRIEVYMGSDLVLTGWVDSTTSSLDSMTMQVSGRDSTCDIVDCSALNKPGEWRQKKVEAIAKDICAVYSVDVLCDVDTGSPIAVFRIQPGESCFEALERLAKGRGLFIMGTAKGEVLITRAGVKKLPVSLKEGENLLALSITCSSHEQYSNYIVEAFKQDKKPKTSAGNGDDPENGMDLER